MFHHWIKGIQCAFITFACCFLTPSFGDSKEFYDSIRDRHCMTIDRKLTREAESATVVSSWELPPEDLSDGSDSTTPAHFKYAGYYRFEGVEEGLNLGLRARFKTNYDKEAMSGEVHLGGYFDDEIVVIPGPSDVEDIVPINTVQMHHTTFTMTERGPDGVNFIELLWDDLRYGYINVIGYGNRVLFSLSGISVARSWHDQRLKDNLDSALPDGLIVRFYCDCDFYQLEFHGSWRRPIVVANMVMGRLKHGHQPSGTQILYHLDPL